MYILPKTSDKAFFHNSFTKAAHQGQWEKRCRRTLSSPHNLEELGSLCFCTWTYEQKALYAAFSQTSWTCLSMRFLKKSVSNSYHEPKFNNHSSLTTKGKRHWAQIYLQWVSPGPRFPKAQIKNLYFCFNTWSSEITSKATELNSGSRFIYFSCLILFPFCFCDLKKPK